MKALVLAAGEGTRLRQLTRNRPKAMLPVGGKPLLEHTLLWLRDAGVSDIAINLNHCPKIIPDYVGDGSRFGLSVCYSYETRLLGTAGAAKRLQDYFNEPFVVVYGDLVTTIDLGRLIQFHKEHRNPGSPALTLSLYRVPNPTQCGLVELSPNGRIIRFVEKPPADQVFTNLASSGILVCEPGILDFVPGDTEVDFGHDLFPKLLAANVDLWGKEIDANETVIDIGTLDGYLRALKLSTVSRLGVPEVAGSFSTR